MTATREAVASRIGGVVLENCYPTPATAALLYDRTDLYRATQAYLWALPAVSFTTLYDATEAYFDKSWHLNDIEAA